MGRHSPADAVDLPQFRAPETTRLSRAQERAAARSHAKARKWRRYSVVPVTCVLLAVVFGGDAYHLVVHPASASAERSVDTATDLNALATGSLSSTGLASNSIEVSRDKRSSDTETANADAAPLPARPGLPAIDPEKTVPGTWVRPSAGAMSSCFCMRWGVFHEGIDLAAPLGSPIVATGDGVVLEAGPAEGFGHWIVVQQSNGDVTIYGHMFTVLVSKGQHVTAGEHIADVGDDGEATGPHLHFGVRKGGINGPYIDPVPWLRARGVNVGSYDPNA